MAVSSVPQNSQDNEATAVTKSLDGCSSNYHTGASQQGLRAQVQSLQEQLQKQHLFQDASHVMVQRAAQMEVDLDQTAAMLCDELRASAKRDELLRQLNSHLMWEKEHSKMAMAAVYMLDMQLQQQARDLAAAKHDLFIARAKLLHADQLVAQSLQATQIAEEAAEEAAKAARAGTHSSEKSRASDNVVSQLSRPFRHNSSPALCL